MLKLLFCSFFCLRCHKINKKKNPHFKIIDQQFLTNSPEPYDSSEKLSICACI